MVVEPLQNFRLMKELSKVQFSKFLQVPSAGGGETLRASKAVSIDFDDTDRMVYVTATNPSDGVVSRRMVPLENILMMELMEDFKTAEEQRKSIGRKSEKASAKGSEGGSSVEPAAKGAGGGSRKKGPSKKGGSGKA